MSEVLEANIFFFITSIAVIIFTVMLCVLLYYLIKITASVRRVIERIEAGSEIIADDMSHFRKYFTENSILSHLIGIFFGRQERTTRSKRAPRKKQKGTRLTVQDTD
jgi:hypothetical protein